MQKEIKTAKGLLKNLEIDKDYSEYIVKITKGLEKWKKISKIKINIVKSGNEILTNLPLHPQHPNYFYVYPKELNFARNVDAKHPINLTQLAMQRRRDVKDIIKRDKKDPLEGHRFFLSVDNSRYAGSGIFINNGNHRLYELYWRYLAGLISGNELIEIKNYQNSN